MRRRRRTALCRPPRRSSARSRLLDRPCDPLGFVWVQPAEGARYVAVQQQGYAEIYEVAGALPVADRDDEPVDVDSLRVLRRLRIHGWREAASRVRGDGDSRRLVAEGSWMLKVAPSPGVDSRVSVPPCAIAIVRVTASPRPDPGRDGSSRVPRSKILAWSERAIPFPRSETETQRLSSGHPRHERRSGTRPHASSRS